MKTISVITAVVLLGTSFLNADEQKEASVKDSAKAQATCPVMGGKVDKNLFVDVKGYRIYVCCKGCVGTIKADPDKYLAKIKAKGETPENTPVAKDELKKENKENNGAEK